MKLGLVSVPFGRVIVPLTLLNQAWDRYGAGERNVIEEHQVSL